MDALRPVELALAAAGRLADEALVLRLLELLAERAAGLEAELRTLELDELLDTLDEPRFVVEVVPEALVVRVVVSCEPDSLTRLLTVVWLVDALGVLLAAVLRLVPVVAALRLVLLVAALRLVPVVLEDAPLPVTLVVPPRVEPVLVTDDAS